MIEIRIHGRGGQGNVVAAYLLASAAFHDGKFCQAFPAFGAERRGAPVAAFVRINEQRIYRRNQVRDPHYMVVQDATLLHNRSMTAGLRPPGCMLVNSTRPAQEFSDDFGVWAVTIPATRLATEIVGRNVPNVALLSALITLNGMMPVAALQKALADRFSGPILEKNVKLVERAAAEVEPGLWTEEVRHAASA